MFEMCDENFSYNVIDIDIQQCTCLALQTKVHVQGGQHCIGGVMASMLDSGAVDRGFKL
jgi:acyl-coenzyme A thioesterase PaaI-like protein